MGLKKRGKVSAEFSMSSLTDIIFLLLIFFMLTSSLVSPNALNLKMPGNESVRNTTASNLPKVTITKTGSFLFEGAPVSNNVISDLLKDMRGETIIVAPHRDAPIEKVVRIMDLSMRYKIETVLSATDDR